MPSAAYDLPMKLPTLLLLLAVATAVAIEPWADSRLPSTNRVELWFDASREPAARQARELGSPINGKAIDYWHDASGNARHLNQRALDARPQWRRLGDRKSTRLNSSHSL